MGAIYAKGKVSGKSETRDIDFLIVERARRIGLPQADIDALGLNLIRYDSVPAKSGDKVIRIAIYTANGTLESAGFVGDVIAAPEPTVGANFLRDLGFQVDWENDKLEKASGPYAGPLVRDSFETLAKYTGMRYEIDLVNWHLTLYPADERTVTVVPPASAGKSYDGEKKQSG